MVTPMEILDVVESPPCEVEEEADDVTVGSVPDSVTAEADRVEVLGAAGYIRIHRDRVCPTNQ